MTDSDDYSKLLNDSFRFLSVRQRSRAEMSIYLTKRGQKNSVSPITIEQVIVRLEELGYVDDKKFAEMWIAARTRTKVKGPSVIRQELKMKGISPDSIEEAFSAASLGDSSTQDDLARQAIAKKLPLWQKLPLLICKKRIYEFLLRRGFSSSVAMRLVDETTGKAYNKG